jgi:hypothetical protein
MEKLVERGVKLRKRLPNLDGKKTIYGFDAMTREVTHVPVLGELA